MDVSERCTAGILPCEAALVDNILSQGSEIEKD
jgi:hypothetical protein